MAKTMYEKWITEEGLASLAEWKREGLSDSKIAGKCGVNKNTITVWKKRHPDIADALSGGKKLSDADVEEALRREALDGKVTAQIFWLKNRRPDKWRDKPEPSIDKVIGKVDELIAKIGESK